MATPQSLCLGFASPPVVFGGGMLGPRGLLRVENLIRPPRPGDTAMQRTATRWQPGRDSKAGRCPDARAGEARSAQSLRLRRPPAPCPGGPSAQAAEGGQVRATCPSQRCSPAAVEGLTPTPSRRHTAQRPRRRVFKQVSPSPPPETRSLGHREQGRLEQVLGILCFHFHSGKIVPHVIMISSLASELFRCVLQINQTFEDFQLFFRYQFTACSHWIYT